MKQQRHILQISDSSKLGLYENTMLGVDDSLKIGEELGCKEGESLGVSEWCVDGTTGGKCLAQMYAMMYRFWSENLNELLINSRNNLYFNLRITSKTVINNELKSVPLIDNDLT